MAFTEGEGPCTGPVKVDEFCDDLIDDIDAAFREFALLSKSAKEMHAFLNAAGGSFDCDDISGIAWLAAMLKMMGFSSAFVASVFEYVDTYSESIDLAVFDFCGEDVVETLYNLYFKSWTERASVFPAGGKGLPPSPGPPEPPSSPPVPIGPAPEPIGPTAPLDLGKLLFPGDGASGAGEEDGENGDGSSEELHGPPAPEVQGPSLPPHLQGKPSWVIYGESLLHDLARARGGRQAGGIVPPIRTGAKSGDRSVERGSGGTAAAPVLPPVPERPPSKPPAGDAPALPGSATAPGRPGRVRPGSGVIKRAITDSEACGCRDKTLERCCEKGESKRKRGLDVDDLLRLAVEYTERRAEGPPVEDLPYGSGFGDLGAGLSDGEDQDGIWMDESGSPLDLYWALKADSERPLTDAELVGEDAEIASKKDFVEQLRWMRNLIERRQEYIAAGVNVDSAGTFLGLLHSAYPDAFMALVQNHYHTLSADADVVWSKYKNDREFDIAKRAEYLTAVKRAELWEVRQKLARLGPAEGSGFTRLELIHEDQKVSARERFRFIGSNELGDTPERLRERESNLVRELKGRVEQAELDGDYSSGEPEDPVTWWEAALPLYGTFRLAVSGQFGMAIVSGALDIVTFVVPFARAGLFSAQAFREIGSATASALRGLPGALASGAARVGTGAATAGRAFRAGRIGVHARRRLARRFSVAANRPGRAMKLPATDKRLLGTRDLGYTTKDGRIFLNPELSWADRVLTLRHESVHRFFSPKGIGPISRFRQNFGEAAYFKSQLIRYTEEALAEGYATRSLMQGLRFPFTPGYDITALGLALEGSMFGGVVVGASYLGYIIGDGSK